MKEYHKIQSLYKRHTEGKDKGKFILGEYSKEEFEYLKDVKWQWKEKIDGTNIRVFWNGEKVIFGGRTDKAQIPAKLVERLQEIFTIDKFQEIFGETEVTLYGEGYGEKIQKVGSLYLPDRQDFILFDVRIADLWLLREGTVSIAEKLGIYHVPFLEDMTIEEAIRIVKQGFSSRASEKELEAEGLVGTPLGGLINRLGKRIIVKLKTKDFR